MNRLRNLKEIYNLYLLKSFGLNYTEQSFSNSLESYRSSKDIHILRQNLGDCHLCSLSKSRHNLLFGFGDIHANVLFLTDMPTALEDERGHFFAGNSGELLQKMIEGSLNIPKERIYITSVLKCRGNASDQEVAVCKEFLFKQLNFIKPKLLVVLGESAYYHLSGESIAIDSVRGKIINFMGYNLLVMYEPSFIMRNPSKKRDAYHDMLRIKEFL